MLNSLKSINIAENGPTVANKLGQSFNLRLLIHYVGDLHQPLHNIARYTQESPNGDFGGNNFKIEPIGNVN